MLIAFVVASSLIAGLLSGMIWTRVTGQPFTDINDPQLQLRYGTLLQWLQGLTAVVGFLLPTILTAQLLNRRPYKLLGFTGRIQPAQMGVAVVILVVALLLASGAAWLTRAIPFPGDWVISFENMEKAYAEQAARVIQLNSVGGLLLSLLVMAVLPAICEEVLFRGGLQNFLTRGTGRVWFSIVVASILFSLAHFSAFGFLSRVVLGIALGAVYYYSGRIWINILLHFLNNGFIVVWLYLNIQDGQKTEELMQQGSSSFWGLLSLPVFVALIWWYKRLNQPSTQPN